MRIGNITTLREEDFPKQIDWIGRLFFPINQFLTAATQAINGNITFGDNIPGVTQNLRFVYSGSSFPVSFRWTYLQNPVEVRVCSAYEDNEPISILFSWSYDSGQITIKEVFKVASGSLTSLVTGSTYSITFRGQY